MSWVWDYPQLLPPPALPADLNNFFAFSEYMKNQQSWSEQMALIFDSYTRANDEITNGLIEFPTPFQRSHTGNIRASYVLWEIDPDSINDIGLGTEAPAIEVEHEYGAVPRMWDLLHIHTTTTHLILMDQIVSSDWNSPVAPGNATASVDIADPKVISGVVTDGWVNNDVRIDDEIYLSGDSQFRRIQKINAGTPDSLVLDSNTDVALGTTGLDYVIRRRPDEDVAWIKVFSECPAFTVLTLEFK